MNKQAVETINELETIAGYQYFVYRGHVYATPVDRPIRYWEGRPVVAPLTGICTLSAWEGNRPYLLNGAPEYIARYAY